MNFRAIFKKITMNTLHDLSNQKKLYIIISPIALALGGFIIVSIVRYYQIIADLEKLENRIGLSINNSNTVHELFFILPLFLAFALSTLLDNRV